MARFASLAGLVAVIAVAVTGFAIGVPTSSTTASLTAPRSCPVTLPNTFRTPYDAARQPYVANNWIWAAVYPFGVTLAKRSDVRANGIIEIKFGWFRREIGKRLRISGHRLDASARPLHADIPSGYGGNFQASGINFPSQGCWRVIGRVGQRRLTFVTLVIRK